MENVDIHYSSMLSCFSVLFPSQFFWLWKHPEGRKDRCIRHLRSLVPERNIAETSHKICEAVHKYQKIKVIITWSFIYNQVFTSLSLILSAFSSKQKHFRNVQKHFLQLVSWCRQSFSV